MDGPIIAFDVSKGSSHMQGYTGFGKPVGKPIIIDHDREGFAKVKELAEKIEKTTGRKPSAVYEYTGVYSKVVERAMEELFSLVCYPLPPLLTAGQKHTGIRRTKNDSVDCSSIAETYYTYTEKQLQLGRKNIYLIPAENQNALGIRLRKMAKELDHLNGILVSEKNCYRRLLDEIWPGFDEISLGPYSDLVLATVFGTPEAIKSERGVLSAIRNVRGGMTDKGKKFAKDTFAYAQSHISGADPESYNIAFLKRQALKIQEEADKIDALKETMIEEAEKLPETRLLETIPGIGPFTAAVLMACIRDMKRFPKVKSLICYAGIDPQVRQSGELDGKHLPITKKGDAMFRKYHFSCGDDPVWQQEKGQQRDSRICEEEKKRRPLEQGRQDRRLFQAHKDHLCDAEERRML